jgi:hypothetical protein
MDDVKTFNYKHKTIRRFSSAGFEFNNFEIAITGEEENERFLQMVSELPARDGLQIVQVNKAAAAASETSVVSSLGLRGAMTADDILTGKDRAAIAAAQAGDKSAATGLLPEGQKPPNGFTGFKNLK